MTLDALYQKKILEHYHHPHNFGNLENASIAVEKENPMCGDDIKLMLHIVQDQKMMDIIRFQGNGCAIETSSSSMMTDVVQGRKIEEIRRIISEFMDSMNGEKNPQCLEKYGDLQAMKEVVPFPARVRCALLPWQALQEAIDRLGL